MRPEFLNFVNGRLNYEILSIRLSDGTINFESVRSILEELGLNQQEILTLGKVFRFFNFEVGSGFCEISILRLFSANIILWKNIDKAAISPAQRTMTAPWLELRELSRTS